MYSGKRFLDLVLVIALAPFWLPALAVVAVLVRISIGSPVLFRQRRIGIGERPFMLTKFRSMRNATDSAGRPLPDAERLTPFGRWLRSTSLDELPEMLNVLRGEMSLVGPRPLLPQYLDRYSPEHRHRHDVRPGLTGLAQVEGRNALTWSDRLDLDIEYIRRASFMTDLRILWRTVRVVLVREGISGSATATMTEFMGYDEVSEKAPERR